MSRIKRHAAHSEAMCFAGGGGFGGMPPPPNFFLNGAFWCVF